MEDVKVIAEGQKRKPAGMAIVETRKKLKNKITGRIKLGEIEARIKNNSYRSEKKK